MKRKYKDNNFNSFNFDDIRNDIYKLISADKGIVLCSMKVLVCKLETSLYLINLYKKCLEEDKTDPKKLRDLDCKTSVFSFLLMLSRSFNASS